MLARVARQREDPAYSGTYDLALLRPAFTTGQTNCPLEQRFLKNNEKENQTIRQISIHINEQAHI